MILPRRTLNLFIQCLTIGFWEFRNLTGFNFPIFALPSFSPFAQGLWFWSKHRCLEKVEFFDLIQTNFNSFRPVFNYRILGILQSNWLPLSNICSSFFLPFRFKAFGAVSIDSYWLKPFPTINSICKGWLCSTLKGQVHLFKNYYNQIFTKSSKIVGL